MSCSNRRWTSPAGNWGYHNLIGATVEIKSVPISAFWETGTDLSATAGEYKVKDIIFKVTTDGKVITTVELDGLEGRVFLWKDLELKCLANYKTVDEASTIIGRDETTVSGSVICGTESDVEDKSNNN